LILHFLVVADLETNRTFNAMINCTEWVEQQVKVSDDMISCPIPRPPTNVRVSVGPAADQLTAVFDPVRKMMLEIPILLLTNACCTSATRAHAQAHHPLRIPSAAEGWQYDAGSTEALGGQWRGGQWRGGQWEVPYFIPADDREVNIGQFCTQWSSEERA
jgi:hypothetical protein